MLTVGVLGPLEVRRDGRPLPVPSGKTTELLVRLAVDAGQVVSAERLIEDLWGDAAAATGRNTLQSKVSQLRRALADPALVAGGYGGYSLALDPAGVDAPRVAALAADAAAARRDGDPAAALEAAGEALALFRGEALADAGDGEWTHPHRARLEELRLGLLEDQAAARVDLGAGGDALAELEWLVDRHPLREGLWATYITALYRAGRQADALAAGRRVRRLLADELGIEPGRALADLERQILRQSAALDPAATAPGPALVVGNLPTVSTPWSAGPRTWTASAGCSTPAAWSPWSGRPESARPAPPWRPWAGCARAAASGWSGWRWPTPPPRSRGWWPRPCDSPG